MKKFTQEEFNAMSINEYGIKICPSGDYSNVNVIGKSCSFGKFCSFGESCSFGKFCSFNYFPIMILRASLNIVSDTLTLELMRRDAWSHPDPELFNKWKENGSCPYSSNSVERLHFFQEKRELWIPGKPEMKDSELIIAICKEKNWKIKY